MRTPGAADAAQAAQERQTVRILVSEVEVRAPEAEHSIPEGFRMATPEEISLAYSIDQEFRQEKMYGKGPIWVDRVGLKDSGYGEILEHGDFSEVGKKEFDALPIEKRARFYDGEGRVTMQAFEWFGVSKKEWRLQVSARSVGNLDSARVAYVRIEDDEALQGCLRGDGLPNGAVPEADQV